MIEGLLCIAGFLFFPVEGVSFFLLILAFGHNFSAFF